MEATIIQKMKRGNISENRTLTQERVKEVWKSLEKEQKEEIYKLAGMVESSFYRIIYEGSISIKAVAALSQIANINPHYLIGTADEIGTYDVNTVLELMKKYNYPKLIKEYERNLKKAKRRQNQEKKAADKPTASRESEKSAAAEDALSQTPAQELTQTDENDMPNGECGCECDCECVEISFDSVGDPDEEAIMLLLKALMLKVKLGVPHAIENFEELKKLLLV